MFPPFLGVLQEKGSGEIRFPEDLPLLCAMCSSEQIWRFVSRKLQHSELYKAATPTGMGRMGRMGHGPSYAMSYTM